MQRSGVHLKQLFVVMFFLSTYVQECFWAEKTSLSNLHSIETFLILATSCFSRSDEDDSNGEDGSDEGSGT